MQTKELQEVYKNAQEVTSLGSTDRVALVDEQGNIKRILKSDLVNNNTFGWISVPSSFTPGWVRLTTCWTEDSSLVYLSSSWYGIEPISVLLNCTAHISAMPQGSGASGITKAMAVNGQYITKARQVKKSDNRIFTDVFFNGKPGIIRVRILATTNAVPSVILNPEIEASDVIKEYNWGGGKALWHNALQFKQERRAS